MSVSTVAVGGGENLTSVGKVAPPIPTMPASRIRVVTALRSRVDRSMSCRSNSCASVASWSTVISMYWAIFPPGRGLSTSFLILPATGECMPAEILLEGSDSRSPTVTSSPRLFTGLDGAPRCCDRGTRIVSGSGARSMGFAAVASLLEGGCTPFLKVSNDMISLSAFVVLMNFREPARGGDSAYSTHRTVVRRRNAQHPGCPAKRILPFRDSSTLGDFLKKLSLLCVSRQWRNTADSVGFC